MFKQIWEDVKKGQNIDLYLAIIAAIVVTFLSLFGLAYNLVAPINLVVLALLAFSILGNRNKLEQLLELTNQTSEGVLSEKFPSSLEDDIINSKDIWIFGVNLTRTTYSYYTHFEHKLRKGDTIKILLVEPDSVSSGLSAGRIYQPISEFEHNRIIKSTLKALCNLKTIAPDKLEIRTLNEPLSFGYYGININSPNGIIYLEYYSYKNKEGDTIPKMVLRTEDKRWFDFFSKQIHILWNNASEWNCQEPFEDGQ